MNNNNYEFRNYHKITMNIIKTLNNNNYIENFINLIRNFPFTNIYFLSENY